MMFSPFSYNPSVHMDRKSTLADTCLQCELKPVKERNKHTIKRNRNPLFYCRCGDPFRELLCKNRVMVFIIPNDVAYVQARERL